MVRTRPPRTAVRTGRVVPVVVAGLLDGWLREPPLAVHPVAVMGRLLDRLARRVPARPARAARVRGGVAWFVGLAGTSAVAVLVDRVVRRLPRPVAEVVGGALLWPLVSLRMLTDEVARVEEALAFDLEAGRDAVARLVSRPVADLDDQGVRAAAISSLAENLVDGWTAPLLWYSIAGLPAAAAYRYVNTADAMWGHRDERWSHAGSVAARADDVANLAAARLTGVLIAGGQVAPSMLRDEARRTPSPNGGWPMGATARRLGIRLAKPDVYVLNPHGRQATPHDTSAAIALARRHACVVAGVILTVTAIVGQFRRCVCRR